MAATARAERRAAAREAIVAAAHALVSEGGWAAAQVHDVARGAGVATGSIYRHFPSKGELLAQVFAEAAGRELEMVRDIAQDSGRPPLERLAAAVEAFARRALAAPTLAYALMAEPVDPAVEEARLANKRAYEEVFSGLLDDAVAAKAIAPLDTRVAAAAIVGALQEALLGPLTTGEGPPSRLRRSPPSGGALIAGLVTFTVNAVGG